MALEEYILFDIKWRISDLTNLTALAGIEVQNHEKFVISLFLACDGLLPSVCTDRTVEYHFLPWTSSFANLITGRKKDKKLEFLPSGAGTGGEPLEKGLEQRLSYQLLLLCPQRRAGGRNKTTPREHQPANQQQPNRNQQRRAGRDWHLVAEADAEDALAGGVEPPDEVDEREDPGLVAVRVGAAPGDDEAVEAGRLGVGGELPAGRAVDAPRLAVLLQQRPEHLEVAAVRLAHVLRVLAALQHRVGPRRRGRGRDDDRRGGGRRGEEGGLHRGRGVDGRRGVLERPHSHGWRRRTPRGSRARANPPRRGRWRA